MKVPVHDIAQDHAIVKVRDIAHKNHYDFTKVHRHTYFEVMFFEEGGGRQIIDFDEVVVYNCSCYIIFPNQLHLLERAPGSHGHVIQFNEDVLKDPHLIHELKSYLWSANGSVIFENESSLYQELLPFRELLETNVLNSNVCVQILQGLLFKLLEKSGGKVAPSDELLKFQILLEEDFKEFQQVGHYSEKLGISDRKLAGIVKSKTGMSPLQFIHNRILLEIRRQLSFESKSHKEIAYDLGFDSPGNVFCFCQEKGRYDTYRTSVGVVVSI